MPGRPPRRRRQHRRGLGPLIVSALAAAFSVYIATHYAIDWGKQSSPPAPIARDAVALAEDFAAPPLAVIATTAPTSSPATAPAPLATPTRTALPAPAAGAAIAPGSLLARVPLTPDLTLANQIAARVAGRSGRYGVAVKNLRTGQGVILDGDGEYEAASLFKLPVMYEVFKQREAGQLSFDEEAEITERHVAYDLGTLDRPAGSFIRLGDALERMITFSDNSSAILLTDRVGAFSVNRDVSNLGLPHTRVLLDDLKTSPGDMLRLLESLAVGEAVNGRASAEMVQLLARQRVNNRLPALLPAGTVVAHKTGNVPGVVNDVGIVYGPSGPFIVVVLVDGTNDEDEAARGTADIALMAYKRFN